MSCLTANQLTPPRCPPPSLRVCPGTHSPTHRSQHPLPPTTPHQPSPSRISASPHSPLPTPAHPTRTLLYTPQNVPAERSDYPLPTAPLPNASLNTLLSQPHTPNPAGLQFYPSASNPAEEATYHALFTSFTSPGLSATPSAPCPYPQSNPNTFRRTSTAPGP